MSHFVLFLVLSFLGVSSAQVNQSWTDYTNGTDCYYWTAPRVGITIPAIDPFNDFSGYLTHIDCLKIIIIPCNVGCNGAATIPCNSYDPKICLNVPAAIIVLNAPYVIGPSRSKLIITGANENGNSINPTFAVPSPTINFYNSTQPVTCGAAFIVMAPNVSFTNVNFAISDDCYTSMYDYLPAMSKVPIVYEAASSGAMKLAEVENSQGADYGNMLVTLAAFLSSDENAVVDILNISYNGNLNVNIFFLNYAGKFAVDATVQDVFVEGMKEPSNLSLPSVIWINAFTNIIDPVKDMTCPPTKQTDSRACDKRKETNLILEIFVGTFSGLIFVYGCFMIWRTYHQHHLNVEALQKHGIANSCQSFDD